MQFEPRFNLGQVFGFAAGALFTAGAAALAF